MNRETAGRPRPEEAPPLARVRRRRFSFVWLIPIVAAVIAGYLAWQTLSQRGPLISITFNTGDGITEGQTQVKHKAVQLGTVESVRLSDDMTHVVVRVRMQRDAAQHLTDHARFWVVRPRLNAGNVSGLETLVSGAFIEMDPGMPGGESKRDFTGLEEPPGVRSDEPGTTYVLKADSLGSVSAGSPVFYRSIAVGEVLGFDRPGLDGKIVLHVFVRKPYDAYVREGTRFWNTSGVRLGLGAQGLQVQLESIQAVLSGGVAFSTPPEARDEPAAAADTEFPLFPDADAAASAASKERIRVLTYFADSVRGLAVGAPVEMFGIRVGNVTGVRLEYDAVGQRFRVPVHMELEPDRVAFPGGRPKGDALEHFRRMVREGLRVQLQTSSYITGQMVAALAFSKDPQPVADVPVQDGEIVLPGEAGGFDNIAQSLNEILAKIDRLPLDQIAQNLNQTLASARGLVGGPETAQAVRDLSATLAEVQALARKADAGMTPVLRRLPEIAASLDETLRRTNAVLGSVNSGYGQDSQFRRDAQRLMDQANDAMRSIRLLADFLDRHPEALIRGRAGQAAER